MVMVAQAAKGPNYAQLLQQGLGAYRQVKDIQQRGAADAQTAEIKNLSLKAQTDPQALAQLAALDPNRAASIQQMQETTDQRFRRERAQTAGQIEGLPIGQQIEVLDNRIAMVTQRGGDPSNTVKLRQMISSGDPDKIKQGQLAIRNSRIQGEREGFLKPQAVAKSPEETTLARNLIATGLKPGTPEFQKAMQTQLAKKAGTTVNVGKGQSAFEVELSKSLVKQLETIREAGQTADQQIYALDTIEAIETPQGALEPLKLQIGRLGESLGIDMSKISNVAAGQAYNAEASKMVLGAMAAQKGPQTESDMRQIRSTVANLGNTPEANNFMITSARALAMRQKERQNFYDAYLQNKGTTKGASGAWNKYKNDVPMIAKGLKTAKGLPVFYYQFEKNFREDNPQAKRADVVKIWKQQDNIARQEAGKRPKKELKKLKKAGNSRPSLSINLRQTGTNYPSRARQF